MIYCNKILCFLSVKTQSVCLSGIPTFQPFHRHSRSVPWLCCFEIVHLMLWIFIVIRLCVCGSLCEGVYSFVAVSPCYKILMWNIIHESWWSSLCGCTSLFCVAHSLAFSLSLDFFFFTPTSANFSLIHSHPTPFFYLLNFML